MNFKNVFQPKIYNYVRVRLTIAIAKISYFRKCKILGDMFNILSFEIGGDKQGSYFISN